MIGKLDRIHIIPGKMQFGETTKSIKGDAIKGICRMIGDYIVEQWELPYLDLNPKTNCFEPTGKTYKTWGATRSTPGGSLSYFFKTFTEAEEYARTMEGKNDAE